MPGRPGPEGAPAFSGEAKKHGGLGSMWLAHDTERLPMARGDRRFVITGRGLGFKFSAEAAALGQGWSTQGLGKLRALTGRFRETLDEGGFPCLGFGVALRYGDRTHQLFARCEVPQIDEDCHGLVVALRLLAGHERVDLAPQLAFAAGEAVEVLLPGDGRLAIAPGLLLARLSASARLRFARVFLCRPEKLADGPPCGSLACRALRCAPVTKRCLADP